MNDKTGVYNIRKDARFIMAECILSTFPHGTNIAVRAFPHLTFRGNEGSLTGYDWGQQGTGGCPCAVENFDVY